VGEGLTLLSLLKLLKLVHIRLSPSAMCRPQFLFRLYFQFFISHAALNLVATQIKISIYLAESADNLPDHRLKLRRVHAGLGVFADRGVITVHVEKPSDHKLAGGTGPGVKMWAY
jgi:hypothetical protein